VLDAEEAGEVKEDRTDDEGSELACSTPSDIV
jgi:hypothetical protein